MGDALNYMFVKNNDQLQTTKVIFIAYYASYSSALGK